MEDNDKVKDVLEQMETEGEKELNYEGTKTKKNTTGCLIALIIWGIIIFILIKMFTGWWSSLGNSSNKNSNKKPDEVELMTYAQLVLDDNLSNPKYSSYKKDYTFIETGLRYKIEGKVNNEKFWMIIEFVDDSYKEYDLISLQVGNKKIR